jgi:hypothetical protein
VSPVSSFPARGIFKEKYKYFLYFKILILWEEVLIFIKMKIEIRNHNDGNEWEKEYYQWNGNMWLRYIDGNENKSGMMIAFANAEYHWIQEFREEDKLTILKHFKLTPVQVPLDKVKTSSPEFLEGILSQNS